MLAQDTNRMDDFAVRIVFTLQSWKILANLQPEPEHSGRQLRQTVYWNRLLYCWTGTVLQPSRSTTTVLLQRLLSCSFTLSTLLQRPLHR